MAAPIFPYPLLIGDIGGTNLRLALVRSASAPMEFLPPSSTAETSRLECAIRSALSGVEIVPASMIVCAAGPVQDRTISLTNSHWRINGPAIARELGLRQGLLLNDFEGLALSLPRLEPPDVHPIGRVTAEKTSKTPALRIVLGPGTGLGLAALVFTAGRYRAIASEAGHVDFAAAAEGMEAKFLRRADGRLTAEDVLSGPGLVRLHQARLRANRHFETGAGLEAAGIASEALKDRESDAAKTVRHFWRLIARFASDMALAFGAEGGVLLGGGILPRLLPLLDESEFRAVFENKAPMEKLAARIPTNVIVNPAAVLRGMAEIAGQPENYDIDWVSRLWT